MIAATYEIIRHPRRGLQIDERLQDMAGEDGDTDRNCAGYSVYATVAD